MGVHLDGIIENANSNVIQGVSPDFVIETTAVVRRAVKDQIMEDAGVMSHAVAAV